MKKEIVYALCIVGFVSGLAVVYAAASKPTMEHRTIVYMLGIFFGYVSALVFHLYRKRIRALKAKDHPA